MKPAAYAKLRKQFEQAERDLVRAQRKWDRGSGALPRGRAPGGTAGGAVMSPYDRALAHIEQHPGTGGAERLAKLLLSLWNGTDCGFSFRECFEGLDYERQRIALGCISQFARYGEDDELVAVGHRVYELYPRTHELGITARDAKAALGKKWEAQREREIEEEERAERERRRDCGDAGEWDSRGERS